MRTLNMKYIKAIGPAMVLAFSTMGVYSQETPPPPPPPTPPPATTPPAQTYTRETYTEQRVHTDDHDGFFNANEFGVSLNTGYVLEPGAVFQQDYVFNLGAGIFYFPCRYFGAEANVPFYTEGVSVSEVQFGLLGRVPIGPVAPYIGGSAVYAWDASEKWAYIGKVGLEFRVNKKIGIFAEGQYRNNEFDDFDWDHGSVSLVGGLRLVF
ncbi:MAG TPA: hypothetical protein VFZ59_17825 [Verrucomicrobiae bacterium]|nr:hypothetical protein [Verrucomicrobiae bacterium]